MTCRVFEEKKTLLKKDPVRTIHFFIKSLLQLYKSTNLAKML